MRLKIYLTLIFMLSFCNFTFCNVFDSALSLFTSTTDYVSKYYHNRFCILFKCCTEKEVPYNLQGLKNMLLTKLYGQHIAANIVLYTILAHLKAGNQKKPLVLSFHGANGIGKTYVSRIIAKAFFEEGENSRFFNFYYGLEDFPRPEKVSEYKAILRSEIQNAISRCERALFVFDGVDHIPPGVLDVLMPFIDCVNCNVKSKKNKAIYIFLTNTGSTAIQNKLLEKINNGIEREKTTLQDFEETISSESLNLKGGLFESLLIKSDAIDFYVPFLPLEKQHVEYCIKDAFQEANMTSTKNLIDEVFQELRFGPEPTKLFSKSGCKRILQIVSRIAARIHLDLEDFKEFPSKNEL